MALKGTSGGGKRKAGRPGDSSSAGRSAGGGSAGRGSRFGSSSPRRASKSTSGSGNTGLQGTAGVRQAPPNQSGGRSRWPWLIIIVLVLLALCCVSALLAGWFFGDQVVDLLRYQ